MRAAFLIVLGSLVLTSNAHASTAPENILRDLAANQTHSWSQTNLTFDALEVNYKAGEHLYIPCGYVSEIARRLLREAGYTARNVSVVSSGEWNGIFDGHVMTEVWQDRRWQLYDVDANLRAINETGQGVSVIQQQEAIREDRALWEPIADDPLLRDDEPDTTPFEWMELMRTEFADPVALYRRIMGTVYLPSNPDGNRGYYTTDASQLQRLNDLVGRPVYTLATFSEWVTLTTTPDGLPSPSVEPVTPARTVAPKSAVPPTSRTRSKPVAERAKRPCRRLKRKAQRRAAPSRAHRAYRRCIRRHRRR